MALGGGNFLVQNKILPGTYINFVSVPRASNIFGDRGRCAIALELDWGPEGIMTVEPSDFQRDSLELFGYSFTDPKMRPVRELLMHAKTAYIGRLNGGGSKAKASVGTLTATALYGGTRGNDITVVVENDIEKEGNFVVKTLVGENTVDKQSVKEVAELKANKFVAFSGSNLAVNAGTKLTGGTNGTVNGESHSVFLEELEKYDFNVVGYAGTDDLIKALYIAYIKRLRDDEGIKAQLVVYNKAANHEGVINLMAKAKDDEAALVYWLTGYEAGVDVNKSLTNQIYDGEYELLTDYKQRELTEAVKKGHFMFHKVGEDIRVLSDINSFTEFTVDKNEDFAQNQVIRVLDQIARDASVIFNTRYVGKVQNNEDGRIALWNDLVTNANTLQKLGAIENFESEDIVVERGYAKDAVDVSYTVQPVMAMAKLYMIVRVA